MDNTNIKRGHLAMLLFSILIAGSFSFGARVANLMEPTAMMAIRFVIAGVVVGSLAAMRTGFKREYTKAPWRYVVLGGLFAIYFSLMFEGLKTASPVSSAAVFTLTPIMSAIFGYFILRQITTLWMALALAIGAAGALWVIFGGDLNALIAFDIGRGETIFFVGCIAHALYTPLVRRLNRGEPTVIFTFGMILAATIILLALGAPDLVTTDWGILPWYFWATLFYLAVCASSMTFFLLQFAAMYLPSAKVMAYTYLTPSWVILWELVLTGTVPPALMLLGVAATIVALVMLLRNEG
ncbi:MAG: DMT family transporter [Amylibacter sp.]|nr:DMT family transporter [Amylibacter sp.]